TWPSRGASSSTASRGWRDGRGQICYTRPMRSAVVALIASAAVLITCPASVRAQVMPCQDPMLPTLFTVTSADGVTCASAEHMLRYYTDWVVPAFRTGTPYFQCRGGRRTDAGQTFVCTKYGTPRDNLPKETYTATYTG